MDQQGSADSRSANACPVCGQHALALDLPPRIDVMGVQPHSDLIGMGDVQQQAAPAIVCRACWTRWRDLPAFEAGTPDAPVPDVPLPEDAIDDERSP